MLSILTGPIMSKVFGFTTAIGVVACLVLGILYYREKSLAIGADGRVQQADQRAATALAANADAAKIIADLQAQSAAQAQITADAVRREQEATARANQFSTAFKDAKHADPQARAWADMPLPASVARLFADPADGGAHATGARNPAAGPAVRAHSHAPTHP